MGLWRGGGEPAHSPVGRLLPGRKGEGLGVLVPRLDLQFGEIHATGVYPGGRPRLEAADGQTQIHQAPGQGQGGSQAVWPGVPDHLAHDGASPQIGAGGHDSRLHTINSSSVGDHAGHSTAFREDLHHLGSECGTGYRPGQRPGPSHHRGRPVPGPSDLFQCRRWPGCRAYYPLHLS